MSMELATRDEREEVRCGQCELKQYRTATGACRRCKKPLPQGEIETTRVVIVGVEVVKMQAMRDWMRDACVKTLEKAGGVLKASEVLGISPNRLKQLLREAGDQTDYRMNRKERAQGLVA